MNDKLSAQKRGKEKLEESKQFQDLLQRAQAEGLESHVAEIYRQNGYFEEYFDWLLRAAREHKEAKCSLAMLYLGIYEEDDEQKQALKEKIHIDYEKALGLFTVASTDEHFDFRGFSLGSARALVYIGIMHLNGLGVPKDPEKARKHLLKAIKKADTMEDDDVDKIRKILDITLREIQSCLKWRYV